MADYSGWDAVLKSTLDKEVQEAVDSLEPNGVLYDVGGNVGSFTDLVLQKLPDVEVYIFEPIKDYYNYIVERFQNKPNVKAFNYALIESNREVSISRSGENPGWNTLSEIVSYGQQELVSGRSLSDLINTDKLPLPQVIKVDIEQSEHLFIEGCKELFKKHIPSKIVMEIGFIPGQPMWHKEKDMIEYLFSLGYKRYEYENRTGTYDAVFTK
jgi:FkbM family methyltransferase